MKENAVAEECVPTYKADTFSDYLRVFSPTATLLSRFLLKKTSNEVNIITGGFYK